MKKNTIIYIDGEYLAVPLKTIEAFTPGHLKAKGVFETMLAIDGLILDLPLHIKRLYRGLKKLKLPAIKIKPAAILGLLPRNHLKIARVRLMVFQRGQCMHVMAIALKYQMPAPIPLRVCFIQTKRPASSRLSEVKSLDYGLFAKAYAQAKSKGYDEALLINSQGHVFEASRANIFWAKNGHFFTPPLSSGCLNGITRQQVMQKTKLLKIPLKEIKLAPHTLKKADAVFLTNSLIGMRPIKIISRFFSLSLGTASR